jgi:N-acyl-phosphatidylethanolamine-hydrolysing phospholipase D
MIQFMRTPAVLLAAACLSLNAACSSVNPYYDARLPHHRSEGFQNNHTNFQPKGLAAVLAWKWQAMREGLPRPPAAPTPRVQADLGFLKANQGSAMQPSVTWIGHASTLVQVGGLNVLTDPIFSDRASPISFAGPRRAQPPGLALQELPRIDAVVISHNHYDHLDEASVVGLAAQAGGPPLFLVPLGHRDWFHGLGIRSVVELDWWQSHRIGRVAFTLTPVQHWSGRGVSDRLKALWGGWAMQGPDLRVFFAGDTGYSADFAEIGRRFKDSGGFDLALIPIGAYEPRDFMITQHVNPPEAVRMHLDLGARMSLGIHWGTFELTDESLDEPPRALARARAAAGVADDDFFLLAIGQTRKLAPRVTAAVPATTQP